MPRLPILLLAAAFALAPSGCRPDSEPDLLAIDTVTVSLRDTGMTALPTVADTVVADTTERPDLPDGFVRLGDISPSIAQEIRYTTAYNFVGEPIRGYDAPECILTESAARALARVARSLREDGLGLKVYDCYRPQRAVRHFVEWANTPSALAYRDAFYPDESKGRLFSRGYIATRSGHSRGSTVDLTLVQLPADASVLTDFPNPADGPLPNCTAPRGERLDERDLDMGTAYDCLSEYAATDHPSATPSVRRNRDRLRRAMSEGGFRNYSKEWWHFTLRDEPNRQHLDFPVE